MKRHPISALRGALCLLVVGFLTACEGENLFPAFGVASVTEPATGTIQGSVTVAAAPLGGVTIVMVSPFRDSTFTDGAGEYQFVELPVSTYSLSIRVPLNHVLVPGDSVTRQVRVAARGTERVNWRLIAQGPTP